MAVILRGGLRVWIGLYLLLSILCLAQMARADDSDSQFIWGTGADGETRQLALDRTPALYTGDFADCLGGQSLFNITKFDAAYYADNMTVLFHLDGSSNVRNESLMSALSNLALLVPVPLLTYLAVVITMEACK